MPVYYANTRRQDLTRIEMERGEIFSIETDWTAKGSIIDSRWISQGMLALTGSALTGQTASVFIEGLECGKTILRNRVSNANGEVFTKAYQVEISQGQDESDLVTGIVVTDIIVS